MKTAILLIFVSSTCWSADSLKGLHVIPLSKNVDVSQFKKEGATIDHSHAKASGISIPFTKEVRDTWLAKSKLNLKIQDWDEFGKDELVIRSIVYTPERLIKAYPKLGATELLKLQEISKRESKQEKL